jgi:threonine/homoserine/homoserine lactone efflux protein
LPSVSGYACMMDASIIPSWSTLSVFFGASLLLAVIPGPVVLYVVARSLSQGRRAGVMSVAGASTGTLVNAFATSLGLATLFATSAVLYSVFKYVGAAYLIYLGIKTLRASVDEKAGAAVDDALRAKSVQHVPAWPLFRDGFIVALFNPKTIIFFSAFLPQFMTQHGQGSAAAAQAMFLSTLFVLIATTSDAVYAIAAGSIAPWLAKHRGAGKTGRTIAGCSFIGLGIFAALSGRKA